MIKTDGRPDFFVVTTIALLGQITQALTVRTGLFMTAEAVGWRGGKFLFRIMAFATDHRLMAVMQGKIRQLMIKGLWIEFDDVCITAFMIRMTGLATDLGIDLHKAVITFFRLHILGNFFMAIQAKLTLIFLAEQPVTIVAIVFVLGMAFDDLAGHDEGFDGVRQYIRLR